VHLFTNCPAQRHVLDTPVHTAVIDARRNQPEDAGGHHTAEVTTSADQMPHLATAARNAHRTDRKPRIVPLATHRSRDCSTSNLHAYYASEDAFQRLHRELRTCKWTTSLRSHSSKSTTQLSAVTPAGNHHALALRLLLLLLAYNRAKPHGWRGCCRSISHTPAYCKHVQRDTQL
jgi:hypothetical protein